jgi:hypothetical protein
LKKALNPIQVLFKLGGIIITTLSAEQNPPVHPWKKLLITADLSEPAQFVKELSSLGYIEP